MFNSYEFVFNGQSSMMYGLMIYDFGGTGQSNVSFGNIASIVETRTNNRVKPIHFGVNYHSKPLEFKLVFGAERELDRYEMESIALWLTGHQDYGWLQICQDDMDKLLFRCIFTELTPLYNGWLPVAFEATVLCDCPYAYGPLFEYKNQIRGSSLEPARILIRNNGSAREYIKPFITFQPSSGPCNLSIVNEDDKKHEFLIRNIPASVSSVRVDNENGIIQSDPDGLNLYHGFNMNFFRLVHGDNNLKVIGDGVLTISGRFLHNVAG